MQAKGRKIKQTALMPIFGHDDILHIRKCD